MQITWLPNPLTKQGAGVHQAIALDGETIYQYCQRMNIKVAGSIAADVNGKQIKDWKSYQLKENDLITLRRAVTGGQEGSNPLTVVAMIAVMALSYGAGAWAVGAMGGASATGATFVGGLASAGVMMGGQMLINHLMSPPKVNSANTAPQFSLTGWANRARQFEPLPYTIGSRRIALDLAGRPYHKYEGGKQYLYQTFCIGIQEGTLSDIKIGETAISNFRNVELFYSDPITGQLPAVFSNVDSIEGGNVVYGTPVTRTSGINSERLELDLVANAFYVQPKGGTLNGFVKAKIEYKTVGSSFYEYMKQVRDVSKITTTSVNLNVAGEAVISLGDNPKTTDIAILSTTPDTYSIFARETKPKTFWTGSAGGGGLSQQNGTYLPTVESPWIPLGESTNTFTGTKQFFLDGKVDGVQLVIKSNLTGGGSISATAKHSTESEPENLWVVECNGQTPFRASAGIDVALGQYEVRVTKFTPDILTSTEVNKLQWSSLKAYQQSPDTYYPDIYRLGIKVEASEELQGGISELSAVFSPFAWTRSGGNWVRAVTNNPASWYREILVGGVNSLGGRLFGANLNPSQVDDTALIAWYDFCASRNLNIGMYVTSSRTVGDVLYSIARVGRASPTMQTGKHGVIVEDPNQSAVAVFGPSNMLAGSFKVNWNTDNLADEVVATFINKDKNWESDSVRVVNPAAGQIKQTATVDLDGVVDPLQAAKAANLLLANNMYHRRSISWETDLEGMVAGKGQVVMLSHDLTNWSDSGRLTGINGLTLNLDRVLADTLNGWVGLRAPDGRYATTRGNVVGDVVTLLSWPAELGTPNPDEAWDWLWFFNAQATPNKKVRITSVSPADENTIRFTARDEDPNYFLAENGDFHIAPWMLGLIQYKNVSNLKFTHQVVNVVTGSARGHVAWDLSVKGDVEVRVWKNGTQVLFQRTDELGVWVDGCFLGDKIRVVVTPTPFDGGVAGNSVEAEFIVPDLPNYDSAFPTPIEAKIFATPNSDGDIRQARVMVKFDTAFPYLPDGLQLCYSVSEHANMLQAVGGGTSNSVFLGDVPTLSDGSFTILAGSTPTDVVVKTPQQPFDSTLNNVGQFWCNTLGGNLVKAYSNNATTIHFETPLEPAPVVGEQLYWAEIAWVDQRRIGPSRLLVAFDGDNYEVLQWSSVSQLTPYPNDTYQLNVTRGREGTTPINIDGKQMFYLPAFGSGTTQVAVPTSSFIQVEEGVFEATTTLDINIPAGYWASIACYVYRQTDSGMQRSAIKPMKYGGNL